MSQKRGNAVDKKCENCKHCDRDMGYCMVLEDEFNLKDLISAIAPFTHGTGLKIPAWADQFDFTFCIEDFDCDNCEAYEPEFEGE